MKNGSLRGFTLIELLVVIVVIAILAAISVIAYVGMQDRATGVRMLSALDAYEKELHAYKEVNGAYPSTYYTPPGEANGYWALVCMGEKADYPANGSFDEGRCAHRDAYPAGFTGPDLTISPSVMAALKTVAASAPKVGDVSFTRFLSTPIYRGIFYQGAPEYPGQNAPTALLAYYIDGNQPCGRGTKQTVNTEDLWPGIATGSGQITVCQISLY